METLQEQVKDICLLADKVIENPKESLPKIVKSTGVCASIVAFVIGGAGTLIAAPIAIPLDATFVIAVLIKKLFKNKSRKAIEQQEKERMLREVIQKQQAVIKKLEAQNADNKAEIENLKRMLDLLNETEEKVKAA